MDFDLRQSAVPSAVRIYATMDWKPIATAPFDRRLELAVIDGSGPHALVFPCRRILHGWLKVGTGERIDVRPTHWREWVDKPLAAGPLLGRLSNQR